MRGTPGKKLPRSLQDAAIDRLVNGEATASVCAAFGVSDTELRKVLLIHSMHYIRHGRTVQWFRPDSAPDNAVLVGTGNSAGVIPESAHSDILSLIDSGESVHEVAKAWEVDTKTIYRVLKLHGYTTVGHGSLTRWVKPGAQPEVGPDPDVEDEPGILEEIKRANKLLVEMTERVTALTAAHQADHEEISTLRAEVAHNKEKLSKADQDHQDALSWREYRRLRHLREVEISKTELKRLSSLATDALANSKA